jgi:phage baseplate assembly protein W
MIVEVVGAPTDEDGYIVDVAEEIRRVLITRRGSVPMNPEYGSRLYELRDRSFDDRTKLLAIEYVHEAIDRWVDRVRCSRVDVRPDSYETFKIAVEVAPR